MKFKFNWIENYILCYTGNINVNISNEIEYELKKNFSGIYYSILKDIICLEIENGVIIDKYSLYRNSLIGIYSYFAFYFIVCFIIYILIKHFWTYHALG